MDTSHRRFQGHTDLRLALLCAVAEAPSSTCATLTALTGRSTMTVKRAVDALVAQQTLIREKRPTAEDGRWGYRLSLHPRVHRLVLDMTSAAMRGYAFCGCSTVPVIAEHLFNPAMTLEENLRLLTNHLVMAAFAAPGVLPSASDAPLISVAILLPYGEMSRKEIHTGDRHFREAYRRAMATRGERLWDDLGDVLHVMLGTPPTHPIVAMLPTEAVITALSHHRDARRATTAVVLDSTPTPHATLLVRPTVDDAWFIPEGSATIPVASLRVKSSPLITPQVVLTHGVRLSDGSAHTAAEVRLALPPRVVGAAYALLSTWL